MKKLTSILTAGLTLMASQSALADNFQLTSKDIAHGEFMSSAQVFQGFGCSGENLSPQLSWRGAPAETKAYAVFAYDPDAPTGSGWWHWQVVNIPKTVRAIPSGAGAESDKKLPLGAKQTRNDYGVKAFGGACPPPGDGAHRYQFTVFALKEKLQLPENASAALTGYMVKANALASATIEALYKR